VGTRGSFPGSKAVGKLTTHFHLVPRSKNAWGYTSTPPIRLHGAVLSEAQGQLYLYLVYPKRTKLTHTKV